MAITSAEYSVLMSADAASSRYIMGNGSLYQPQEGAASDAAGRLLESGMLEKVPGWPDCLQVTEAGLAAMAAEAERRNG